jgi:hypothetical protein
MIVEHALKIACHCGKEGLGTQGRSAWPKNQWSSMVSRATASGSTSCKMAGPTGPRDTHELGAVCYVIIPVARAFGQPNPSGSQPSAGPQKWRRLRWTRVRPQKHISGPESAMSR